MKLLKEASDNYKIDIVKFNEDDLILRDKCIWIIGRYKADGTNLPPLEHKKIYIRDNQIAQANNYIYIPKDQLNDYFDNQIKYNFPRIIDSKTLSKNDWKKLKTKYPYRGR